VKNVVALGAGGYSNQFQIMTNRAQIDAIQLDPNYNHGRYKPGREPVAGLAIAREIGFCTFISPIMMEKKFAKYHNSPREPFADASFHMQRLHDGENYLRHQAWPFGKDFDANSMIYLLQTWNHFDLAVKYGSLAKAFERGVNDLPLSFVVSWFEQKAVSILLTLLHLGIKDIRLGPSLPAFVSPNILNVLVEKFGIAPIGSVDEDLAEQCMAVRHHGAEPLGRAAGAGKFGGSVVIEIRLVVGHAIERRPTLGVVLPVGPIVLTRGHAAVERVATAARDAKADVGGAGVTQAASCAL